MIPWVVLIFAVSLSYSCAQGSSAVTVHVKKGEDVPLDVMKAKVPEKFIYVEWKYERNFLVRFFLDDDTSVFSNYIERIELSEKKYSVTLKNLQDADSGIYTAQVIRRDDADLVLAEYTVIVLDQVSPVGLTVDSVSNSPDSCNVTVTCRTQDSHINSTFRCDTQTCSQEGGEQSKVTTSGASLQVYLESNSSIICNHSNQVSWAESKAIIEHFCPLHAELEQQGKDVTVIVIAVVVPLFILIIIVIVAAVLCLRKRGKNNRESIENTVYEVPQIATTAQPPDQRPTHDVSELSPTSTYCLVGPHTGSVGSTETRVTTLPESLYAQVEKPARPSKN